MTVASNRVVLAAIAAVGLLGGSAVAFAVSSPESALTAKDVYSSDMSPEEISSLSQGREGEPIPPCPDEETVTDLKERGLPIGPCDPMPEGGQQISGGGVDPNESPEDGKECVASNGSTANPQLNFALDCAVGARIIETYAMEVGNELCVAVRYVPEREAEEIAEVLCSGDPPSSGGVPVGQLDRYAVVDGEWQPL